MSESSERFQQLGEYIQQQMTDQQVPGVAVGVLHDGVVEVGGYGVTNVDHPLEVDGDTILQVGSISKTVTGTVVMMLVERGLIDLDVPLRHYLPDLRMSQEDVAARVTMRHALTHTGGWYGDFFDDTGAGDDALTRMVARMVELEQRAPLGAVWSYNNAGFYLAGRVIEVVTGRSYEAVVQDTIFDPLGMDHSFFFAADAITYRVAAGHQMVDEKVQVARPWGLARAANPVGGILSTVRDMLRYAQFVISDGAAPDGTQLLSTEAMKRMQTEQFDTGRDEWVGLSWYLRDAGDVRIVTHTGGTKGQNAVLIIAPGKDFALAVLTNGEHGDEVHRRTSRAALRLYLGVVPQETAHIEVSQEKLGEYSGRYIGMLSDYDLTADERGLIVQFRLKGGFPRRDSPPAPTAPAPIRMAFYGDDRVISLDPSSSGVKGDFLRDADGKIAWFRIGGRMARREE